MSIDVRAMLPEEWSQGITMWEEVFGVGGWLFRSLHDATEDRKWSHTGVAVTDEGKVVSAVDLFMRPMRGVDGKPVKVAAVGSVATYEAFRRQGLSGRLIQRGLEVMAEEGCAYSFLFTGSHGHYRAHGWFDTPLRFRKGTIRADLPACPVVEVLDDDGIAANLETFAQWFAEANATRPLSHVRSLHYWKTAIRPRMGWARPPRGNPIHTERKVLLARENGVPVSYVAYDSNEEEPRVFECCGNVELGLLAWAHQVGPKLVGIDLPDDEPWNSAVEKIVSDAQWEPSPWSMARALPHGMNEEEIRAIFAAPGAHHWSLDAF